MSVVAKRLDGLRYHALGKAVGFGPGDIVLDGDPVPPPKNMGCYSTPQFWPMFVVPNEWMDQDTT